MIKSKLITKKLLNDFICYMQYTKIVSIYERFEAFSIDLKLRIGQLFMELSIHFNQRLKIDVIKANSRK